jgi:hypothetical protein
MVRAQISKEWKSYWNFRTHNPLLVGWTVEKVRIHCAISMNKIHILGVSDAKIRTRKPAYSHLLIIQITLICI